MANLPVNYTDPILDTSVNVRKKYTQVFNPDGSVSFIETTTYLQNPSFYGAAAINAANQKINDLEALLNEKFDEILVTFPTASWQAMSGGFYQTRPLIGATAETTADCCLKLAGQLSTAAEDTIMSYLNNVVYGSGTVTVYAKPNKPSTDIVLRFKGV